MKNTSTSEKKMQLFKLLLFQNDFITITELKEELTMTSKMLSRYIAQLSVDIEHFFPRNSLFLVKDQQKIQLYNNSEFPFYYLIDMLETEYIQQSHTFHIISALLSKKYTSQLDLAEDLYISQATLYKQLAQLKLVLNKFQLDISFKEDSGYESTTLVGDQKNIRIFMYNFYWYTFKGLKWPFKNDPEKNINEASLPYNPAPSEKKKLNYIIAVTSICSSQEMQPLTLDSELRTIATIFLKINDLSDLINDNLTHLSTQTKNDEKLFFNLFIRLFIPNLDTDHQSIQISEELLASNSFIVRYCHTLIEQITIHFSLTISKTVQIEFLNLLILFQIYMVYFPVDPSLFIHLRYPMDLDIDEDKKLERKKEEINTFYQHFLKEFQFDISTIPNPLYNQAGLITLIYSFLESNMNKKIVISVHNSKNVAAEKFIENKIKLIFSNNIIELTNDIYQADLVISDSYEGPIKSNFFYLEKVYTPKTWNDIFICIKNLILDKHF